MSERTVGPCEKRYAVARPELSTGGATTQFPQRVRAFNNFLSGPINKFTRSVPPFWVLTVERAKTCRSEYRELTFTDLISTKLSSLTRGASYAS